MFNNHMRKKFFKKGISNSALAGIVLGIALLIILFAAIKLITSGSKESVDTTICQMTLWSNAQIGKIPIVELDKRIFSVKCNSRESLVLKYSDFSKNSKEPVAISYQIMKKFADEQVITHNKALGTREKLVLFPSHEGMTCIYDRKISFDESFKKHTEVAETLQKMGYLTYLVSSKMPTGKKTYAEYLYNVKEGSNVKTFTDNFQKMMGSSVAGTEYEKIPIEQLSHYDLKIDPNQDYYIIHFIVKGDKGLLYMLGNDPNVQTELKGKTGLLGALYYMFKDPSVFKEKNYWVGLLSLANPVLAITTTAVTIGTNNNYYNRYTALVPENARSVYRCSQMYGDVNGG